ncbi:hypothetical protein MSI_24780 [Treponema sp. JC4]|uniref:hypothetical protein n=1 Tax=Treponema sp. JC4 TaxID=1124982 RepID=UPI00025AFDC7|nr:hypothetical protein [Treponema sp. JC4]EID84077.1 hypothetical protein MSI_24780 [Treponema sp. JC4]
MKVLKKLCICLLTAVLLAGFVSCANDSSDSGSSSVSANPFDGTSWYGSTKDFFTDEVKNDVKLLVFDKVEVNGSIICRCENVEALYFGGSDNWRLTKGQKLPYSVKQNSDGSFEATTTIFKYSVVIPSADSTTGYVATEHNGQILKIEITKK